MSYFAKNQCLILWLLYIIIFTIISLTGYCKSTTDSFDTSIFSLSSSSSGKTFDQEIGSPSELAWQAWLLIENKSSGQSILDSASVLRRITPKSIFIAPELISCPNGYISDGKGICKPIPIKIDEDAQRQFFLKRLNALYGKFSNNRKKPIDATGPLQINIPISLPSKSDLLEIEPIQSVLQQELHQETQKINNGITENRLPISVKILQHSNIKMHNPGHSQDSLDTVIYTIDNNMKKKQKESAKKQETGFFLGNFNTSSTKQNIPQMSKVFPIPEMFQEINDTFSSFLDYKIPINLKTAFNKSNSFNQTNLQQFNKNVYDQNLSDNVASSVVLLLSSTRSPFKIDSTQIESKFSKIGVFDHLSLDRKSEKIEDARISWTKDETKSKINTKIDTVSPLVKKIAVDSINNTIKNTEKTYIQDALKEETICTGEESKTKQGSNEYNNYHNTTDTIDQDKFSESEDELLKDGKDSMMIVNKNSKQYLSDVTDIQASTVTVVIDTTPMPMFTTINIQNSFDPSDTTLKFDSIDYIKEDITTQTTEISSTIITSEPNLEESTTIASKQMIIKNFTNNTAQKSSVPLPVKISNKTIKDLLKYQKDITLDEKRIYSTPDNYSITSDYGNKKTANVTKIFNTPYKFEEFQGIIIKTESTEFSNLHTDNLSHQPILNNNKPILLQNDKNIPSEFKDQTAESSISSIKNFRKIDSKNNENYFIRFPEQNSERLSKRRDYVRFPSDEVNSIYNQENYKDHLILPYHSRQEYTNSSTTYIKRSNPTHQNPLSTYWRVPISNMRIDHQSQKVQQNIQMSSNDSNQSQQRQKPMLLRFWARMPLVRDLTFFPTSHGSHNEPIGGLNRFSSISMQSARKNNPYNEMSLYNVNRLVAQKMRQPAIGEQK